VKVTVRILLVALLFTLPTPLHGATNKAGGSCPKAGNITTIAKEKYNCQLVKKKLIWVKVPKATVDPIISAISAAMKITKLPANLTPSLTNARTDKSEWLKETNPCSIDFADVRVPSCLGGDPNGTKLIILYGDSHASMWMPAIDAIAKKNGYRVELYAKLACPLIEAPVWSYQLNRPFSECIQWQQLVLPKIKSAKPDLLIVTDQWKPAVVNGEKSDFDTETLWEKEFPKALATLNSYAKKLVVIGNNPSMTTDSINCVSKPGVTISICASVRTKADNNAINKIEQAAAISVKATFIDTVAWACDAYMCPAIIDNKLVYFDQWHFTATYVDWLTPSLAKALMLKY
jgi:hypothetical protein